MSFQEGQTNFSDPGQPLPFRRIQIGLIDVIDSTHNKRIRPVFLKRHSSDAQASHASLISFSRATGYCIRLRESERQYMKVIPSATQWAIRSASDIPPMPETTPVFLHAATTASTASVNFGFPYWAGTPNVVDRSLAPTITAPRMPGASKSSRCSMASESSIILRRQPHAEADMASNHPTGMDDGKMGKGDRMQDR